jgi:hypothetical protein
MVDDLSSIFHEGTNPVKQSKKNRKNTRQTAQNIPVFGVKSGFVSQLQAALNHAPTSPAQGIHEFAPMIDQGRYPGIGGAYHGPSLFDATQTGVGQMLAMTVGFPPPSIVGHHGQ